MSNTKPDRLLASRRARVESLLWDWAEQLLSPSEVTGHASTSPTYRMMMQATPNAAGKSRTCGPWQGRQRRNGGELSITPAGTCYGRETRTARVDSFTQPEMDADRMAPSAQVIADIVLTFPAYQRDILQLRFIERVRDFKDIARIMRRRADDKPYSASGFSEQAISTLYKQALDHIYRLRFEVRDTSRQSVIPEYMPAF